MAVRIDESYGLEKDIQATVVKALKTMGYLVQETSLKIRGKRTKWNLAVGIDAGIPDLLIGRDGWGPIRFGLEMKGAKTPLSDVQQDLYNRGLIRYARTLDEALQALMDFQDTYGLSGPRVTVNLAALSVPVTPIRRSKGI